MVSEQAGRGVAQGDEPACCDACASQPAAALKSADFVPLERGRRPSISRTVDRRITIGGLLVSAVFLGAAVATVILPEPTRHGLWLPVHLALAGGAGAAVAAALPFFVAALSVVQPEVPSSVAEPSA